MLDAALLRDLAREHGSTGDVEEQCGDVGMIQLEHLELGVCRRTDRAQWTVYKQQHARLRDRSLERREVGKVKVLLGHAARIGLGKYAHIAGITGDDDAARHADE